MRDQTVKSDIENTFLTHPAYGHRRLALELKINHKRVLRVMRKYGLKPPRLWYQEKFTTKEAVLKVGYFPHIFHCDRGGENLSQIVTGYLEKNKTKISVSDPASPWQNAWSESFFSRFKTESGHLNRFETLGELIEYIFSYLNYYNSIRIHTKIKMSPYQFKQKISESGLEKWGT